MDSKYIPNELKPIKVGDNDSYLWAATGDQPKAQFVLSLGPGVMRYHVWKFRTDAAMENFKAKNTPSIKIYSQVPGYRIIVMPLKSYQQGLMEAIPRTLMYMDCQGAARFYATHKILPNEKKFQRYRQA